MKPIADPKQQFDIVRRRLSDAGVPNPERFVMMRGNQCVVAKRSPFGLPVKTEAAGELGSIPPVSRIQELVLARGMPWREEYAQRVIPYFGSDERVDQMGDIVRQDWIFDEFEKNSPMPYSHDWDMPPVGRVIDWSVVKRKDKDYSGPALYLLGLFASGYEWAESVFRLTQARILVTGSVGFYAGRVIDVKDEEERQKLGLGKWGLVFEQNHLLEFSPTTIPANPGAVIPRLIEEKKSLTPNDIQMLRELARIAIHGKKGDIAEWSTYENAILSVARAFWPEHASMFRFHKEMDFPVTLTEPMLRQDAPPPPPPPAEGEPPPAEEPKADPMKMLQEIHAATIQTAKQIGEIHSMVTALAQDEEPAEPTAPPEGEGGKEPKKATDLGKLRDGLSAIESRLTGKNSR